jgi:uncharacterized repeat protein (TIGR01451 family)
LLALFALGLPLAARAGGTPAGTQIRNTVTLSYTQNGRPDTAIATAPALVVAKVITVVVSSQDSAPVPTNSPDSGKVVSFAVTNTGNATETFGLARNNTVAGDQFDPVAAASGGIWIESGAQPGFQASGPNADTLYAPGITDLTLAADASRQVYVVSNIPAGQPTGSFGRVALVASSTTPGAAGAAPGTVLATSAQGVQTVVGAGNGRGTGTGSYLVSGVSIGLAKSVASVQDANGGTRVMSGSVITYRLVLSVVGSGVASGVTVRDPLPAELSYVPGSITVDGAARTDAADGDDTTFSGGAVQANFGGIAAPATRVIEFKATVN